MTESTHEEANVEDFYDREDAVYRSFWDSTGALHWGYFSDLTDPTPDDFTESCRRWTDFLLRESGITAKSRVLDVGCGSGSTTAYIAAKTGCRITGVDISGVRVASARADHGHEIGVTFDKASASELPYSDGNFTHVWSQATLLHLPDRIGALRELHRVLTKGGVLAVDDLVTPTATVTAHAKRFVYDRVHFKPGLSHESYKQSLESIGFRVTSCEDLTPHLRMSYELLGQRAKSVSPRHTEAYREVVVAIDSGDVGWSYFVAVKE